MKNALIELGVPEERIHCDYAGFNTFDSVIRAKKIFGLKKLTIVSQNFHNKRAIFIARSNGIDAIGFDADEVNRFHSFKTKFREHFAKVKTVLDVMRNRKPHFLGEPIEISQH